MTAVEFWIKAEEIFSKHRRRAGQFTTSDPTGEEHCENVSDFLTDMDALMSEWYNRREIK